MKKEWYEVDELAASLEKSFGKAPKIAAVLGSGLGEAASGLEGKKSAPTSQLTHWPTSTVSGHAGAVHTGRLGGSEVAMVQGRVHLYEGYAPEDVVRPIRALITWGVETVIITNAAGGVNPDFEPGSLMLIEDHLNMTGRNCLVGPNDDARGTRFPDMSELYAPALRRLAAEAAKANGIGLCRGVYAGVLGPSYETPAEVRMFGTLGADAVGMSTVLEAVAAKHLGANVMGISCITNRAAGLEGALLDHEDVKKAGAAAAGDLIALLSAVFEKLAKLS